MTILFSIFLTIILLRPLDKFQLMLILPTFMTPPYANAAKWYLLIPQLIPIFESRSTILLCSLYMCIYVICRKEESKILIRLIQLEKMCGLKRVYSLTRSIIHFASPNTLIFPNPNHFVNVRPPHSVMTSALLLVHIPTCHQK